MRRTAALLSGADKLTLQNRFDQFLELGVPRLLDAEDLRVKPYPDKLSMATFCIELRRRWDGFVSGKGLAASAATVASSGVAATAQVVAGALIADKENRELNRMLEAAREEIAVLRRDLANATRTHQQAVADWEAKLSAEKKLRSVAGNAGNVELEKKLVEERERREEVVARLTARLSEQAIECDNLSKQIARPRPSAAGGGSFFGAVKWLLTGALLGGGALWYWVFTRTGA